MSKFTYSEDIPKEVLKTLQDHFEPFSSLIPGWCEDVRIFWRLRDDSHDGELVAGETTGHPDYRWAAISICPGFIDETPEDKLVTVRHELVHVLLSPWSDAVDFVVRLLAQDNPDLKTLIEEQMREKSEMVTQDISTAIDNFEKDRVKKLVKQQVKQSKSSKS